MERAKARDARFAVFGLRPGGSGHLEDRAEPVDAFEEVDVSPTPPNSPQSCARGSASAMPTRLR